MTGLPYSRFRGRWIRFWMRFSGLSPLGRLATRLAAAAAPPYKGRTRLAMICAHGFISPSAEISHRRLEIGKNVFIGDRVAIYQAGNGGSVRFEDRVMVHRDCIFETGRGGNIVIGERSGIQAGCQFSAYAGDIQIGKYAQIAPRCSFYPYNHGIEKEARIHEQPLTSKGGIFVGDDVWLGVGVTILENVRIGSGAVVGANSLVTGDIPEFGIAAGNPAKIIGKRN